jgi:hypothetical protein
MTPAVAAFQNFGVLFGIICLISLLLTASIHLLLGEFADRKQRRKASWLQGK